MYYYGLFILFKEIIKIQDEQNIFLGIALHKIESQLILYY